METGENNQQPTNQADPALAVNLDALSQPEGGYDPDIHGSQNVGGEGEDQIPGGSGVPEDLPNLDGNAPNTDSEPYVDESNRDLTLDVPDSQNPDQNQDQNQNAGGEDHYWMKPFEQLKAANPEWEIPQGVSEDNYLEVLQQVLEPQQPELHPELQKMQQALDSGVEWNQMVEQLNQVSQISSMSDRDLLSANYKETYKAWDDNKVKEVIDKLDNSGLLEIEATKLRNAIDQNSSQMSERMRQEQETAYRQQAEQINVERAKQINDSLDIINRTEDVYGLPLSQAEKADFASAFSKMVTPDESGVAPMFQLLQSNENLVKVAAMLWKGDDKVRAALTDAKESGKAAILGKLDKSPKTPIKGGGSAGDPNSVDLDALSAPERVRFG